MEPVRSARQVFFPLDEEFGLLPGHLTPKYQEHLAHLGCWMPFERAREMREALLGIPVSEPTVRRGTEPAGACYQARQTAQSQQETCPSATVTVSKQQVISIDGAYVPLLGGEWAEGRTVAIGEVKQGSGNVTKQGRTDHLSSFSRMTDAEYFADLAAVEMQRRGVSQATAVCAVTDGAPWLQGVIDLHRADAVRIWEFPHAAEHLGLLLEALRQATVPLPDQALERCLPVLKHRGPGLLLCWCERLPEAIKALEGRENQLDYFGKRLGLMPSPDDERQGWPIGSGMVESANKVVGQARLKGAGMPWAPSHVNPMLALRTAVCNERWNEAWQERVQERRVQRACTRHQHALAHMQACLSSLLLFLLRFRPSAPTAKPACPSAPRPGEPAATLPGSSRPSAHHPWKRSPACRPSLSAKI